MINANALSRAFGNLLIGLSIFLFLFLYFPLLKAILFKDRLVTPPQLGSYIQIPSIAAQAPIIDNVDPWNEVSYREALTKGVARANDSNFFFAHSSDVPWRNTRYNAVFLLLDRLESGDEIIIYKDGEKSVYKVSEKKIINPGEVEYLEAALKSKNPKRIIVQTCTPIGTSIKRLLVFADLIE